MQPRNKNQRTKKVETLAKSVKGDGEKRLNLIITAKEHKALKLLAVETEISITELVKKAVNEYTKKEIFE